MSELIECGGTCGRMLPSAIDISRKNGKGTGKEAFLKGEALAYDERDWDWICIDCINKRDSRILPSISLPKT